MIGCEYCDEEVLAGEAFPAEQFPSLQNVHRECVVRMFFGSVAHQRGECACSGGDGEDDPSMTKRAAAKLAYDEWQARTNQLRIGGGTPCLVN